MSRKLPSFPSLRAFEAAARHLSFKAAAEELCVTQSAISHQIKALEEFLETPLFIRRPQSVQLTLRGSEYQTMVSHLLDGLESATQKIRGKDISGPLHIQASSAFASFWLLPRILRFNKVYPNIELNLTTIGRSPDKESDSFDIRINCPWEVPPGSDSRSEAFISSARIPVCSPELLETGPPISKPSDLLKYPILREEEAWDDWERWFELAGFKIIPKLTGARLDNVYLTQKAAEDGQGITLGVIALIAEKIALGRLIPLLKSESATHLYYTISYAKYWKRQPKIVAFREWLHTEAGPCSDLDNTIDKLNVTAHQ